MIPFLKIYIIFNTSLINFKLKGLLFFKEYLSYEKISQFISILDKYSLKKSNPFNLKLIKEVLKMI
jgi:hypothetical protein